MLDTFYSLLLPAVLQYQGEDPVLAGRMVAAEVAGIQSMPVLGCVKHYVNNNQVRANGMC